MISKAQVMALCAGDSWLEKAANLLMFGPPGGGKSHLAAASAWLWWRTAGGCCSPARRIWCRSSRAPGGPAAGAGDCQTRQIPPADPDDLAYVTKDQAETSVLFELISARYERRSLLITANQPFGEWGRIFPDQAMTLAAVDRLVHHATIFEMNVELPSAHSNRTQRDRDVRPLARQSRPHPD